MLLVARVCTLSWGQPSVCCYGQSGNVLIIVKLATHVGKETTLKFMSVMYVVTESVCEFLWFSCMEEYGLNQA
jgi:hypothetical protein